MLLHRCLSLLALVSLGACGPSPSAPEPFSTRTEAIISGKEILPDLTRVVLITSPGSLCSGTLLSSRWVLTARHCVTSDLTITGPLAFASNFTVSLGSLGSARGLALVEHPFGTTLDVVLLQLDSKLVSALPIQLYRGPSLVGKVVRCMGYGNFTATGTGSGTGSGKLRYEDFKVVSSTDDTFTIEQSPVGGAIPAHGDSGGPCFAADLAGNYVSVAGVMSRFPAGEDFKKLLVARTEKFDAHFAPVAYATPLAGAANPQGVAFTGADKAVHFDFVNIDGVAGLDYVYFGEGKATVIKATTTGKYEAAKKETSWAPTGWSTGWSDAASATDMTGDGRADFVYTGDTSLWVGVGLGDGSFKLPVAHALGGPGWKGNVFLTNVDGVNGGDYVQLRGSDLYVSRSSGTTATFPAATKSKTLPSPWDFRFSWSDEFDGTGGMDLAYVSGGNIAVVLATGGSSFGGVVNTPIASQTGWEPFASFKHVNADKRADFVAIRNNVLYTQVASTGGSFFSPMVPMAIEWGEKWEEDGQWADMNGDKLMDFAAYDGTHLWVKLANGLGGFTRLGAQNIVAPDPEAVVRFVDANGDKKDDLVFVFDDGGTVMLVSHLSTLSSGAVAPLDEVPDPESIVLSGIPVIPSFTKYWGMSALERLCRRISCFDIVAASKKADGAGASGLLATIHPGLQGQRVTGLLPESGRASGWDWTRSQEAVGTGDVDGDGRDEVVLRDERGLAFLGRDAQTGAPRVLGAQAWDSFVGEWLPRQEDTLVHVGDFDGEPGAELLVRSREGAIGLLRLSPERVLTAPAVYPEGSDLGMGPLTREDTLEGVGDHDGDGRLDVVVRGREGWTFLRGTPQGLEPWSALRYGEWLGEDVLTPESHVAAVGRFHDSQGPVELLVRGEAGYTLVRVVAGHLEPLAFFPWGAWVGVGPLMPEDSLQLAGDMDGNGLDDLRVQTHEGVAVLGFGNGQLYPVLEAWYGQDLDGWDLRPEDTFQAAGDLNGDGRKDLVVRREDRLGMLSLLAWDPRRLQWSTPLGPSEDGLSVIRAGSVYADLDGDGLREVLVSELAP